MSLPLYLVDAFVTANGAFTGNPAGVCVLDKPADERFMQSLGMEMNQAETAFVHRLPLTDSDKKQGLKDLFNIRWFTPSVEVDLCGHATLASAHTLFESK